MIYDIILSYICITSRKDFLFLTFVLLFLYIYNIYNILELSMLSYQNAMPKVKLLCKKYNILYVQENVFLYD